MACEDASGELTTPVFERQLAVAYNYRRLFIITIITDVQRCDFMYSQFQYFGDTRRCYIVATPVFERQLAEALTKRPALRSYPEQHRWCSNDCDDFRCRNDRKLNLVDFPSVDNRLVMNT